jgi:YfiR/HmsC-like
VRPEARRGGPLALLALALALAAGPAARPARADAAPGVEYQLKAVFLYNFTQFVDWPEQAFAGPDAPLVIGILGQDPFDGYLDDVVRGEKAAGHPIVVKRYRDLDSAGGCHMLFVGGEDARKPEALLAALKDRVVLTVGDSGEFSQRGGMIDFVTKRGKIRFRINVGSVRAARLMVSSKLLRLADIVAPGKG